MGKSPRFRAALICALVAAFVAAGPVVADPVASAVDGPPLPVATWADVPSEFYGVEIDPYTGLLHLVAPDVVSVRDAAGREVQRYGEGVLVLANDVAFTDDMFIVGDSKDEDGSFGGRLVFFERASGEFLTELHDDVYGPFDVEHHDGVLYVADIGVVSANASIDIYDLAPLPRYRGRIDGDGTEGELRGPLSLTIHDDDIYVLERSRVVVFDLDGNFKWTFDGTPDLELRDIEITDAGEMYLTFLASGRVAVFELRPGIVVPELPSGIIVPGLPALTSSRRNGSPERSLQSAVEVTSFEVDTPFGLAVDPGGRSMWVGAAAGVEVFSYSSCAGLGPTIVGTSFDDEFTVPTRTEDGPHVVVADAGDDRIDLGDNPSVVVCGGQGNDTIAAQDGNQTIYGDSGDDRILTGTGRDMLYGDEGDDWISAGAGNDYVRGGTGNDTIDGGPGNDRLFGEAGSDVLRGSDGRDVIRGGVADDTIEGGLMIDRLSGNGGADVIRAGNGRDRVYGNGGDDLLFGGGGNDRLFGGAGIDELNGQVGTDHCDGESLSGCEFAD